MTNDKEIAIQILRSWASSLIPDTGITSAFVYGSLVSLDGSRFDLGNSDIDLLLVFSDKYISPFDRTKAQDSLSATIKELEQQFFEATVKTGRKAPSIRTSTILVTKFEFDNNVHKDAKRHFWETAFFLDLTSNSPPRLLSKSHTEAFHLRFGEAVEVLHEIQNFRKSYLQIQRDGTRKEPHEDYLLSDYDFVSKKLARTAAKLRFFVTRKDKETLADPATGVAYIIEMIEDALEKDIRLRSLRNRLTAAAGRRIDNLTFEDLRVLWELLANQTISAVKSAQRASRHAPEWRPAIDGVSHSFEFSEQAFLDLTTTPSLKVGGLDLACKLFPAQQWSSDKKPEQFEDDPESDRQLLVHWVDTQLPEDLLDRLMDELQEARLNGDSEDRQKIEAVYNRLQNEGSNAYPRLVATPYIQTAGQNLQREQLLLNVSIAPSRYGVALVEERKLQLATARQLRSRHILNSLGVRIAYVTTIDGEPWVDFHQRHSAGNATYSEAWDIGAAGYIDAAAHRDPANREKISPWQTASRELSEELGIARHQLPHRDKFNFFGVARNDFTGQLDLVGYCAGIKPLDLERPHTARVQNFDRCRLTPTDFAMFVLAKEYWVPTALLTGLLVLRAYGYKHEEIESAMRPLVGKIITRPD